MSSPTSPVESDGMESKLLEGMGDPRAIAASEHGDVAAPPRQTVDPGSSPLKEVARFKPTIAHFLDEDDPERTPERWWHRRQDSKPTF
ncbi:hypothetical protein JJD41_11550 [Oxynema sp. CENA135]|uniref:hypothetical protein n=1 Tax=Oxynema sp. CENA135 TaxID=984206 RepID=UPI00190A5094|nr:hypothetical protein [Oxynema sp. CENA135]MBK4730491.1 hypothetical protein [Oxynema sp. CENA135]